MVALKTYFDGERIIVPDEMRGSPACEVIVVLRDAPAASGARGSIFDVIGKAARLRTAEDIDAQVRRERDEWGDR